LIARIRRISLLLVACGLLAISAAPAHAAFPGNNGKIVFISLNSASGSEDIRTVNPDGSGGAYIGDAQQFPASPKWSPDGARIVWSDDPGLADGIIEIRTMNPDGSGVATHVANQDIKRRPSWSPDGRKFVYHGAAYQTSSGIYTINANGSGRTLIWGISPVTGTEWSPDGTRIVFDASSDSEIYTIKPDGTGVLQLTSNGVDDRNPSWSPDGNRIVFDRSGIWIMNADGSGQTAVTNFGSDPVWSPDGTKIAFVALGSEGNNAIFVMNADGSGVTQITSGGIYGDSVPDWQPLQPTGYARVKTATPTTIRLVPAYEPCKSGNASHGPPLAAASCSPPIQSSDYLTVGSPEANGLGANSIGRITMKVVTEAPIDLTNGDQSDVTFTGQITDVRDKQTLADYTGELRASFGLRLTDRMNGTDSVRFHPATAADATFGFSFGCTPTPSAPSVGSTCSVATSADAAVPGITPEFKRSIWQLGQVEVYDGGADGDGDTTGDNTLFMTQGLFAP
jgi:TolB protein